MNKIRKTLVVVFSALFVLCTAMFAAGCNLSLTDSKAPVDAETPDTSKNAYTVSVDVNDPSLGKYTLSEANCGDGYEEGSLVTFTVKPNEDYEARLSINGEEVELQGDTYTLAVTEDVQASVEYIYKYEIYTYVTEGKGTIELSDPHEDGKYHAGDDVTVTVTPEEGYELKEVLVNGSPVVSSDEDSFTYTIENLSGRTYVVAKFGALHTVTLAQENEMNGEEAKGEVTLTANDAAVESGVTLLSEGTEVTLTVKPKEGETFSVYVDGYYQVPVDGENGAKTVTFTVKADTVVKVVWDTYYTVSIKGDDNADVMVYLQNYETKQRRFLAGTEIDFTVIANAGYEVVSVKAGEELTPVSGVYTLTVDSDVTIEVDVQLLEVVKSYNVSVSLSNTSYGEAELSGASAKADGTYAHGSSLTLTVTPKAGYKLNYVTVNGARVKMTGPDEQGKYTTDPDSPIIVTADTKIYVAFGKTDRYNVRMNFYGLAALVIEPTLNGNEKAQPNDVYLSASCYEGQKYTFALGLNESNAFSKDVKLYYSLNGAEPVLWEKSENGYVLEGTVGTENISYIFTCELPALEEPALSVEAGSMVGGDQINAADYVEAEVVNGEYVYTFLADPTPDLCPEKDVASSVYAFKGWIVTVNGNARTTGSAAAAIAALAEDPEPSLFHEGDTFNVPYAEGTTVTIEAVWEKVGYVLNLTVNNLPDHTMINVATYRYIEVGVEQYTPERVENIFQIGGDNTTVISGKYLIKVSDAELVCQVEIQTRSDYYVTLYDPEQHSFKGITEAGTGEGLDPTGKIWTDKDYIISWGGVCAEEVGGSCEFEVTYTKMYRVFLDGYEQSDMMVVDGDSFTLSEDLVKTSKPTEAVHGEWIYHWYQEGGYSKYYYNVNDKIEDVHGDLHLVGEWVVPVKLTISFPTPVSKDGTAPKDMFFAVMWRGQVLETNENYVFWSPSIQSDEPLKFYYNIPDHWMTYISYYVSEDAEMGDASRTMAYYHGNTNNYDYNGDGSAGVPAPTCALDKYSYMKLEFTFTQRHVLSLAGDNLDQVEVNRPDMVDGYYYDGYYHGRVVDVTITAKTGWILKSVTADKPGLLVHSEEKPNVWTVTMTDDVTLTITVEKQPVSFPARDEGTEETSGAPVQGEWQSASEESPSTLSFTEDSVTVNGEEVERIGYEGEGGEIVYTLETETKTYTLEWYGKVAGYILALTDTTSVASPVALFAAEAPANVTYFVNPTYGDGHFDAFKEGDAAKLVGEWTAEDKILTFSELEGQAQASLDGNSAKYLFAVAEGHYLMVIGTTAYDMTLEGYVLKVNDVEFHTQYQVTVTEDGDKVEGCSYTLKNVDADVTSDRKVDAGTVLTLTVNAPEGYTVSVVITGGSYEAQDNTYTITVSTNTEITITYTAPVVGPQGEITNYAGTDLLVYGDSGLRIALNVETTYSDDDIKTYFKLNINGNEYGVQELPPKGANNWRAIYFLITGENGVETLEDNVYSVHLYVNGELVSKAPSTAISANNQQKLGQKTYTLSLEGEAQEREMKLTVSTPSAPVEKTISFAGTAYDAIEGKRLFVAFVISSTNYSEAELEAAVLHIGSLTFNASTIETSTSEIRFWIIDTNVEGVSQLNPDKYAVTLELDGKTYECPTVQNGTIGEKTVNGKIYTLSVEGEGDGRKMYLNITEEKTSFTVTVEEKPEEAKGTYTLKKDNVDLGEGKITKDDVLTLEITALPEGYTKATVSVTGATLEGSGLSYTIKNATADVVITITYTKEGEEQVREIVAIEGDGKTHFYGEQWFEIHISKDDSDFLKEYDSTLRGRVNGGNAIGFQVKNYDACFFQINVGEDNYEKSFDLEWLDGEKVIAKTHYVCTIPESHHVTLTVEGDGDGNTATLNPPEGDIKRNTQVVLTITVKEGWTVGVTVNNAVVSLSDQDNGTKTYSFKLTEDTNISVTFIDEGAIEAKTLAPLRDHTAQDIYPNDRHYFKLYLANDGLEWIKNADNGVSYVLVDDREVVYSLAGNKGYDIDGDHIKIQYTWIERHCPKTITLHWMNVAHVEVATTEVHFSDGSDNLVKAAEGDGDAKNFPNQWSFYDADGQVTSATYENGTFTVSWDKFTSVFWAIQLYYAKLDWAVGTKYTVSFNVTAKQDCSIQFFEGDPFNKVIELKKDTQVSFTSPVATLNGNYQAIRMFVCPVNNETPGRVNTGTITITDLKIEKAEYTFTDASLAEENGKVYFVLSGIYSGYGVDDLKTALEAYTYNFESNGFYSGGYESKGTQTPERNVKAEAGTFTVKFDITAMPCYGYNFHFNGDWYDLSEVSSIHGKTLTYNGKIYTLYNFGRNVDRNDSTFWHLLGLTIWDESKPVSWDANKGLTNNYTLNQGETVTLSATIEDATNWGIVALLMLNGQDGILIAPDKVSSYIEKKTADVSGEAWGYKVTSNPGENLDAAKVSGASVIITIVYTDSTISVTYTIEEGSTKYTHYITVENASEGSYVVGFAQSGGTNTDLNVTTKAN